MSVHATRRLVTCRMRLGVLDPDGTTGVVPAVLTYDPADPYAIRATSTARSARRR